MFRVIYPALAVLAVAAIVTTADAAWVEKNDLAPGGRLIANGDDLYYIRGNSISLYNAGADSWGPKTSSTFGGYSSGDMWTVAFNIGGKFILKQHRQSYVQIYDIGADSWSKSDLPTGDFEHSWDQGAVYNTAEGKFWTFWTDAVGDIHSLVGAAYDPVADSWGAAAEYSWPGEAHWGRIETVNIGATNFIVADSSVWVGQNIRIKMYDLAQGAPFPTGLTTITSIHDLGDGNALASNIAAAFGTQCMAVYDGKVYMTGMDMSGEFVMYDPATNAWTDLPSFLNGPGGYRDHSTAVAGGVLYVQDFNQFLAYDLYVIPEPGTIMILAIGGLGLLTRLRFRKRG